MKMYALVLTLGLAFGVVANADQSGQQPYPQPAPIDQFPPDQSFYCQQQQQCAPPVLPYPGPQLQPVVRPMSGFCQIERTHYPFLVIVMKPSNEILYGPAVMGNVQAVFLHYQRLGICRF